MNIYAPLGGHTQWTTWMRLYPGKRAHTHLPHLGVSPLTSALKPFILRCTLSHTRILEHWPLCFLAHSITLHTSLTPFHFILMVCVVGWLCSTPRHPQSCLLIPLSHGTGKVYKEVDNSHGSKCRQFNRERKSCKDVCTGQGIYSLLPFTREMSATCWKAGPLHILQLLGKTNAIVTTIPTSSFPWVFTAVHDVTQYGIFL